MKHPPPSPSKRQYSMLLPQQKLPLKEPPIPSFPKLPPQPHHQAQLKQAERTWE